VTLLSMAMALALSVVVWRMLRDDRRRSDARVQMLRELAAAPDLSAIVRPPPVPTRPPAPVDLPLQVPDTRMTAPRGDSIELRQEVFLPAERHSRWRALAAVAGVIALAAAAAVLIALTVRTKSGTMIPARTQAPQTQHVAASSASALELLSLRDAREPGVLTISGIVQNPRGGATLKAVTVTADTFDANGAFLASGHALIDVTTLTPGDRSPFAVSVPASSGVARYRVSFRGEDGHVIEHLDRRPQATTAANWATIDESRHSESIPAAEGWKLAAAGW